MVVLKTLHVAALYMAALLSGAAAHAHDHFSEAAVKALLIRNVLAFVRWPADAFPPGKQAELCLVGHDELGTSLDGLNGYPIGKSALAIRRIDITAALGGKGALAGCRAIYLCHRERRHLPALLAQLGATPALTIADFPGGAQLGAAISFDLAGARVVFDANPGAAQQQGLQFDARLLRLARKVY